MINGHINEDLFSLDIKRFQKFHSSKKFIMDRVTETLGDLYGMHWPYKQQKLQEMKNYYLIMMS